MMVQQVYQPESEPHSPHDEERASSHQLSPDFHTHTMAWVFVHIPENKQADLFLVAKVIFQPSHFYHILILSCYTEKPCLKTNKQTIISAWPHAHTHVHAHPYMPMYLHKNYLYFPAQNL